MRQKKEGFIHVRLDADLKPHVDAMKQRPGGISRFVNDCIRESMHHDQYAMMLENAKKEAIMQVQAAENQATYSTKKDSK